MKNNRGFVSLFSLAIGGGVVAAGGLAGYMMYNLIYDKGASETVGRINEAARKTSIRKERTTEEERKEMIDKLRRARTIEEKLEALKGR